MEFSIIAICIVLVIVVGIILYTTSKKKNEKGDSLVLAENDQLAHDMDESDNSGELCVTVEPLPSTAFPDETKLVEITDSNALAQVDALFADFIQAGNAVNNAAQAARLGEGVIYRAIIPAGAKLTNSKAMEGAFRGFYRDANGIQGHANFVSVDTNSGVMVATNVTSAMMSTASIVVGQYYMAKISKDISSICEGISRIAEFQDNEYRSKVSSLFVHVMNIAESQTEILENDELRKSKIIQLDNLEMKCTELLDQANLTLEKFAERTFSYYEEYEKHVYDADKWGEYQYTLLLLLHKISELKYVLGKGAASRNHYTSIFRGYLNRYKEIAGKLTDFKEKYKQFFGIELDKARRKNNKLAAATLGLLEENFKYKSISEDAVRMMDPQRNEEDNLCQLETEDFYAKDSVFVYKDGKTYYFPA